MQRSQLMRRTVKGCSILKSGGGDGDPAIILGIQNLRAGRGRPKKEKIVHNWGRGRVGYSELWGSKLPPLPPFYKN